MKLRATLLGLALLGGVLAPAVAPLQVACAAEGPRAALVVDTGSEVLGYCVALPRASVSGFELIQLANDQHGLSYYATPEGFICMLANVGPTGANCDKESEPDFWAYWHGTSSGGWSFSGVGSRDYRVTDGDVEGWSYGRGTSGSSHPPPRTPASFEAVCAQPDPEPTDGGDGDGEDGGDDGKAQKDEPKERGDGEEENGGRAEPPPKQRNAGEPSSVSSPTPSSPRSEGSTPQEQPDDDPNPEEDAGAGEQRKRGERGAEREPAEPSPSPTPTPAPTLQPTPTPTLEVVQRGDFRPPDEGSGPPAAGVAGLGLALILGGAGVLFARHRRRTQAA